MQIFYLFSSFSPHPLTIYTTSSVPKKTFGANLEQKVQIESEYSRMLIADIIVILLNVTLNIFKT